MEAIARKRFIRQSPYKIRYVLKTIKGLSVDAAINKLSLTNKKASVYIEEVLKASISICQIKIILRILIIYLLKQLMLMKVQL